MDQERFKQEVVPLRGRMLALAGRMLGDADDAGDVAQETLLKLWTMRAELDGVRSLPAFATRMTKNACLNRLKTRKRHAGPPAESTPTEADSPHRQLENRENLDRTMRIIDALPPAQRMILRMKHVDGLEPEQIAALTGSTPEAVRMNLSRARRAVKERFLKGEK